MDSHILQTIALSAAAFSAMIILMQGISVLGILMLRADSLMGSRILRREMALRYLIVGFRAPYTTIPLRITWNKVFGVLSLICGSVAAISEGMIQSHRFLPGEPEHVYLAVSIFGFVCLVFRVLEGFYRQ